MNMKQQNNFSKRNRKVAISRWKKEEEKYKYHLKSISKSREYKNFKARLMGFLAGDGNVDIRKENKRKNAEHHDVAFYPDHHSMIDSFVESFYFLYLKKPKIVKKDNYYILKVSSKPACLDLIKTATFSTHGWEVPFNFLDTKESKIEWLKAFFDCEAYVGNNNIRVQSVNKEGLQQVKQLLEELKIESKMYKYERKNKKWNTNYVLSINKKSMGIEFLKTVGFNHELKNKKLENRIASVPESG